VLGAQRNKVLSGGRKEGKGSNGREPGRISSLAAAVIFSGAGGKVVVGRQRLAGGLCGLAGLRAAGRTVGTVRYQLGASSKRAARAFPRIR
jgi:hypothetical protein